jgi:hypothetical protein
MARGDERVARRSSLSGDLRIIAFGTWAFLLQLFRSWRLTAQLLEQHDDQHDR